MKTEEIELAFLNIGDIFELSLRDFYYKITKEEGQRGVVEMGQNKKNEEGWISCPSLTGSYCGCNYKHGGNKDEEGELNIIKIRVSIPFNMGNEYRNYLTFHPSQITSITIITKKKGNVLDKIGHVLSVEKNVPKN
jgi:hypothetical protein